LIALQAAEE